MLKPFILAVVLVAIASGCGSNSPPPTRPERFKRAHAATVTPFGRIDLDSVEEISEAEIGYRTSDGSKWKVNMDESADGLPRFGQPIRLPQ